LRSQAISLSCSPASGRTSPATRATSRTDGRRSGIPLGVIRAGKSRLSKCKRSHKASPFPNETARARSREDLLLPVARIEDFQLAAQDRRQPEITLAGFKYQFPAPYDAARAKWLQHGEFPIIELWKGYGLRIAVELLIFVKFGHKQIR
jgi:hypothetical protein